MMIKTLSRQHLEASPLQMLLMCFFSRRAGQIGSLGAGCGTNSLYSSLFCAPSVFVAVWPLRGASLALAAHKPKSPPAGQRVGLLPSSGSTCRRVYLCEASYVWPGRAHASTQRCVLITAEAPQFTEQPPRRRPREPQPGAPCASHGFRPHRGVRHRRPSLPFHKKGTRAHIAATWSPCARRWALPV
jgi:hypothetical protein